MRTWNSLLTLNGKFHVAKLMEEQYYAKCNSEVSLALEYLQPPDFTLKILLGFLCSIIYPHHEEQAQGVHKKK